jgi:hypothetical protein
LRREVLRALPPLSPEDEASAVIVHGAEELLYEDDIRAPEL